MLNIFSKNKNETKGFLWKVTGLKGTAYILGTIHVGFKGLYPLDKNIINAFNESSTIFCEANISKLNIKKYREYAKISKKYMFYKYGDNVYNHLSDEYKEKYLNLIKKLKLKEERVITAKPIYVISLNEKKLYRKYKMKESKGLDMYFLNIAKKKNKKILELEGFETQFKFLSSLDNKSCEELIDNAIYQNTGCNFKKYVENTISSFKTGILQDDIKANLMRENNSNKAFLTNRNKNMVDRIAYQIDNSTETNFVIIGLAHVVGLDNVINILKDRGYKVSKF